MEDRVNADRISRARETSQVIAPSAQKAAISESEVRHHAKNTARRTKLSYAADSHEQEELKGMLLRRLDHPGS